MCFLECMCLCVSWYDKEVNICNFLNCFRHILYLVEYPDDGVDDVTKTDNTVISTGQMCHLFRR